MFFREAKDQVNKRLSWLVWIIIMIFLTCHRTNNWCHHSFSRTKDTSTIIWVREKERIWTSWHSYFIRSFKLKSVKEKKKKNQKMNNNEIKRWKILFLHRKEMTVWLKLYCRVLVHFKELKLQHRKKLFFPNIFILVCFAVIGVWYPKPWALFLSW